MLTHSIDRPLAFTEVRNQRARLGAYNFRAAASVHVASTDQKHASLLHSSVNYQRKRFYMTGPRLFPSFKAVSIFI